MANHIPGYTGKAESRPSVCAGVPAFLLMLVSQQFPMPAHFQRFWLAAGPEGTAGAQVTAATEECV